MRKRLRKKLHKGEFLQLGLPFVVRFKDDTEIDVTEEWLDELADLLNVCSLNMIGSWNSYVCSGFINREHGNVTEEEEGVIRKWFDEHGQHLESSVVSQREDPRFRM